MGFHCIFPLCIITLASSPPEMPISRLVGYPPMETPQCQSSRTPGRFGTHTHVNKHVYKQASKQAAPVKKTFLQTICMPLAYRSHLARPSSLLTGDGCKILNLWYIPHTAEVRFPFSVLPYCYAPIPILQTSGMLYMWEYVCMLKVCAFVGVGYCSVLVWEYVVCGYGNMESCCAPLSQVLTMFSGEPLERRQQSLRTVLVCSMWYVVYAHA